MKAWDFCAVKARSVEIVYKDDELEEEVLARVHFNVNIDVSTHIWAHGVNFLAQQMHQH